MPKIAEMEPMRIKFDSEEERQKFIRWASDKSTRTNPQTAHLRRQIAEARAIKGRMRKCSKD